MAQPTAEISLHPEATGQEVKDKAAEREGGVGEDAGTKSAGDSQSSTPFVAVADPHVEKNAPQSSSATDNAPSTRPSLVALGSSTPVAPQPKRFSAVNINKKFLEKNTAPGSSATNLSASSTTKTGSPAARPVVQPTSSHSRLVTAKLTANTAVSSTPAGWSRPSSVAPSSGATGNTPGNTSPLPSTPSAQSSSTAAPQLPHVGKVIQPQPRTAGSQLGSLKESVNSKPVWRTVRPGATVPSRPDIQPNDFPTAAEVANDAANRKLAKPDDSKDPPKSTSKQLRSEEADTFRGVHLDPNAHHWDEMEGDDDDFLNGVIEFGDGRQYKVETSDSPQPTDVPESTVPVSKEERFVDDFDRSWPKSKESPVSSHKDLAPVPAHSTSPKSHHPHSPQDSSRVLFNERSNRLEPYNQSHRPPPGPFAAKRSSYQEPTGVEPPRSARDNSHNIQVLQKPSGGDTARSRRFSSSSSGYAPSAPNGLAGGHRESRRDAPPTSPRMKRGQPNSPEATFNESKRSSMGPPPVPVHATQKDVGRQLPPHISPNLRPRRLSTRESQPFSPPGSSGGLPSATTNRIPPHSPAGSQASFSAVSPIAGPNATLPTNVVDLDEVRKDVMQTAAARAKARRQQEEDAREAQRERARRKAAEIEEKMKAAEAEKTKQKEAEEAAKLATEREAIAVIEEAVKSAMTQEPARPPLKATTSSSEPFRPAAARRPSIPPRTPISGTVPSPASQTDTWRTRTNPQPPAAPKQIQSKSPASSASFATSGPSAAEQVASIADAAKEDLEVVDFSDMGKFVGVPEESEEPPKPVLEVTPPTSSKPARPSASDFFEELSTSADISISDAKKVDFGAWRRKVEVNEAPAPAEPKKTETTMGHTPSASKDESMSVSSTGPETSTTKEPLVYPDSLPGQTVLVPSQPGSQRLPLRSQFREAPMSALDDTMLRIKGVLSGMQGHDAQPKATVEAHGRVQPGLSSSHLPSHRWVPPALRARGYDDSDEPQEVFLVTILERPATPPPATSSLTVSLPPISRPVEFISKKQLFAFNRPPYQARMDILSFDPPVYDMNRRTWSLNDVLFRGSPAMVKANYRYRVVLPKFRGSKFLPPNSASGKPNGFGAFGRPTVADGMSSWRKPLTPSLAKSGATEGSPLESNLDTRSRSPPPQLTPPENAVASIPTSPTKTDTNVKRRSQPQMPEGSAVAFVRDSRIDVVESTPKPAVNFIFGSELDESKSVPLAVHEPGVIATSRVIHSPLVTKTELKHEMTKAPSHGPLSHSENGSLSKVDGKPTGDSGDHSLGMPNSHHAGSWARPSMNMPLKESPSRAPDPEHLKAVWSQPSGKADVKPVNSLKGIADDLTSLPFVLPEVKPEEGVTLPPSLPSAPSRMLLHDVTRGFQQVPTSSSTSSQPSRDKTPISPPTTNAPVARPTSTTYTYAPTPQTNVRPAYGPYPSPMLAHSPAPMMYGHPMTSSPVPGRMQVNGHAPLYTHPMWMPIPGPSPQAPGNVMRPAYVPQMMSYPAPGYAPQPPHAHPNIMPPPPAPQGQGAGRGRGMMMSPVMSPAHAHPYAASPVMMHPHPQQNHGYMPVPAGRGQPPRNDSGHMQPPHQQNHPSQHPHQPPAPGGFNPGPASPYARAW